MGMRIEMVSPSKSRNIRNYHIRNNLIKKKRKKTILSNLTIDEILNMLKDLED